MRPELIRSTMSAASAESGEAEAVAESAIEAMSALFKELNPLVGTLATQALYRRALHLARSSFEHPGVERTTSLDEQLVQLRRELAARAPADAARAGAALRRAFADLLVSLIGRPLTHRLLRSAWGLSSAETYLEEQAP